MTTRCPTARKTLVLSDNVVIARALRQIVIDRELQEYVDQAHSPNAPAALQDLLWSKPIDLKRSARDLLPRYNLLVSAHSKQIFPKFLVEKVECINIHPGYNPETRGWFPQVWSIIFGHRLGMTVHRMDALLDHGPIIDRIEIPVYFWDTSKTAYDRVVEQEIRWLYINFENLLSGQYSTFSPEFEGNLFLKQDFSNLCEIDLDESGKFRDFYDRLRALSFDGYANAFVRDPSTGKKVYIELSISPENPSEQLKNSQRD